MMKRPYIKEFIRELWDQIHNTQDVSSVD